MRLSDNTMIEAAYLPGTHQADWLRDLGQAFRRSIPSALSCFCYEIISVDGQRRLGGVWAEDPQVATQIRMGFEQTPPELLDMFCAPPLQAATTRELLEAAGVALESTPLGEWFEGLGFADVFAVTATDSAGYGVVLGVGLARPGGPPSRERVEWTHVAAHVAAARHLPAQLDIAEILRGAVEHARKRARSDAEALSLWQGLIDGRWSLVEQFESDGRRYYVAVRNSTDAAKIQALTRREAEVAAYVASGTTTKVTAFALGLDEVTVRGYLRTAMTKLGLRSRAELVALRATLEPGTENTGTLAHSS
jgi:DNA-binding CsgD family transcriptional regulator